MDRPRSLHPETLSENLHLLGHLPCSSTSPTSKQYRLPGDGLSGCLRACRAGDLGSAVEGPGRGPSKGRICGICGGCQCFWLKNITSESTRLFSKQRRVSQVVILSTTGPVRLSRWARQIDVTTKPCCTACQNGPVLDRRTEEGDGSLRM